jgi:hypothetical protein
MVRGRVDRGKTYDEIKGNVIDCMAFRLHAVTGVGIACCLIPGTLVELSVFRPHELLRQNGLAGVPQNFDHRI